MRKNIKLVKILIVYLLFIGNVIAQETFTEKVLPLLTKDIIAFGDDKVAHMAASYIIPISCATDYNNFNCIRQSMIDGFMKSYYKGIDKELMDRGIDQTKRELIISEISDIMTKLDNLEKEFVILKLDQGDLIADLIGASAGTAALGINQLKLYDPSSAK